MMHHLGDCSLYHAVPAMWHLHLMHILAIQPHSGHHKGPGHYTSFIALSAHCHGHGEPGCYMARTHQSLCPASKASDGNAFANLSTVAQRLKCLQAYKVSGVLGVAFCDQLERVMLGMLELVARLRAPCGLQDTSGKKLQRQQVRCGVHSGLILLNV